MMLEDSHHLSHDGDVALGAGHPVLEGQGLELLAHLEQVVAGPDHALESRTRGEVPGPVGVRVGGIGEKVVVLDRVLEVLLGRRE